MIESNLEITGETQKVYFIDFTPYKIGQKSDKKLTLLI